MDTLDLDIETFCELELKGPKSVGVYQYVNHTSFQVMLLTYSLNNGPKRIFDLYENPQLPEPFINALLNPEIIKRAHNWTFERLGLSKHIGIDIPAEQGECTMVKSAMLGLPLGLKEVGKVLNITEQKDSQGAALLRYFTKPCKPTKANGHRSRNLPEHAPEAWKAFKRYNITDVSAEQGVEEKTAFFQVPAFERQMYILDQKINDRGFLIDRKLVENALQLNAEYESRQRKIFIETTGIRNPKSNTQIKDWIYEKSGVQIDSLRKEGMDDIIEELLDYPEIISMLEARGIFNKTSIKKYNKMLLMMGDDDRIHHAHQYYGAIRTGRFAGRGIQPHNLPRTTLKGLEGIRHMVREGDFDLLETCYDVNEVLSQLLRPAIIAPEDHVLGVSDFTSIEAVVISWLAGERWRLDAFKNDVDIYKLSASQMFGIPLAAIDDELRQRGKVSELSLGFQGAEGALIRMGALKKGILLSELPGLVTRWRQINPAIVKMWYTVQDMARDTIKRGVRSSYRGIFNMFMHHGRFIIELPSGRWLVYHNAVVIGKKIMYENLNDKNKWALEETYGGKLVENIVQAIARDILCVAMRRLDAAGFRIVMHVHDEIIMELLKKKAKQQLEEINKIMALPIKWAKGAPIKAKSFISEYYKKD